MTFRGFFLLISEAEGRGERRVWFRDRDTQVVCHYDIKCGHLVSFCGGIFSRADNTAFLTEPWEYERPEPLCIPCAESIPVV